MLIKQSIYLHEHVCLVFRFGLVYFYMQFSESIAADFEPSSLCFLHCWVRFIYSSTFKLKPPGVATWVLTEILYNYLHILSFPQLSCCAFLILILSPGLKLTEDLSWFGMIKEVKFALECYLKPAFYTVLLIEKNDTLPRSTSGKFSYFMVWMCERTWNVVRESSCFFLPSVVLQMG